MNSMQTQMRWIGVAGERTRMYRQTSEVTKTHTYYMFDTLSLSLSLSLSLFFIYAFSGWCFDEKPDCPCQGWARYLSWGWYRMGRQTLLLFPGKNLPHNVKYIFINRGKVKSGWSQVTSWNFRNANIGYSLKKKKGTTFNQPRSQICM